MDMEAIAMMSGLKSFLLSALSVLGAVISYVGLRAIYALVKSDMPKGKKIALVTVTTLVFLLIIIALIIFMITSFMKYAGIGGV